MKRGKEFYSRFLGMHPNFYYLAEEDKFLQKLIQPTYKANIIGTGMIGLEHMRVTFLERRATIHGIYDTKKNSLDMAKLAFGQHAPGKQPVIYDSLEEACNDPEVDLLMICTPNYTHIDVLRTAIKSGKHIFMEKPMASTVEDAYEMMKMTKGYKAMFQVGLQYRYKAIYREAIHEALERKTLGDIVSMSLLEHRIPFLDKVDNWNKFSEYSGGTLVEKCCHYFDLLNMFAQSRPARVFASGSMALNFKDFEQGGKKSDILDNAFVTVEYENGIRAGFNIVMFSPMFFEQLILCGEQGHLIATEREDFLSGRRLKNRIEIVGGEERPSRIVEPHYPEIVEGTGHNGATFMEHILLIDNIEGKKTNTATVEEGFWSVVVGASAEESAKTGRPVDIPDFLKSKGVSV